MSSKSHEGHAAEKESPFLGQFATVNSKQHMNESPTVISSLIESFPAIALKQELPSPQTSPNDSTRTVAQPIRSKIENNIRNRPISDILHEKLFSGRAGAANSPVIRKTKKSLNTPSSVQINDHPSDNVLIRDLPQSTIRDTRAISVWGDSFRNSTGIVDMNLSKEDALSNMTSDLNEDIPKAVIRSRLKKRLSLQDQESFTFLRETLCDGTQMQRNDSRKLHILMQDDNCNSSDKIPLKDTALLLVNEPSVGEANLGVAAMDVDDQSRKLKLRKTLDMNAIPNRRSSLRNQMTLSEVAQPRVTTNDTFRTGERSNPHIFNALPRKISASCNGPKAKGEEMYNHERLREHTVDEDIKRAELTRNIPSLASAQTGASPQELMLLKEQEQISRAYELLSLVKTSQPTLVVDKEVSADVSMLHKLEQDYDKIARPVSTYGDDNSLDIAFGNFDGSPNLALEFFSPLKQDSQSKHASITKRSSSRNSIQLGQGKRKGKRLTIMPETKQGKDQYVSKVLEQHPGQLSDGVKKGARSRKSNSEANQAVESFLNAARLSRVVQHPLTGRKISFSEVGNVDGSAVFCCVGMGLTRFVTGFYDELASTLNLRLITPDRPGVGGTEQCHADTGIPLNWSGLSSKSL